MPDESSQPASFSRGRRWGILFSVILSTFAVVALVVMVNYLGARHFARGYWSSQTRVDLSPQTVGFLRSITNEIKAVLYYDKRDPLYDRLNDLLDQYHLRNPKISVERVDYLRDSGAANIVRSKYNLTSSADKNLVIFDCSGRYQVMPGASLGDYSVEAVPDSKEREFRKQLKGFRGEQVFNGMLLGVTSEKPLIAYFLEGNGEHPAESTGADGYQKFVTVLQQKYIASRALTNLLGSAPVPDDCNLLIVAGPRRRLSPIEIRKIKEYLAQGGRLMALFNYSTIREDIDTGLEGILTDWGVEVGRNIVLDKEHSATASGYDVEISDFDPGHPLVNPLLGSRIDLLMPRSISAMKGASETPDAPKVEELFFTSPKAAVAFSPFPANHPVPLAVAVEKGAVKGVFTERGLTKIVIVGDSTFLSNAMIDFEANRDFAGCAVNWLLDQTQLLKGAASHPITEYKLLMTRAQMNTLRWIFLAGMPGGILLLGGLVWLRRRH